MKKTEEMTTVGVRLRGPRENLEKAAAVLEREWNFELLPWRPDGGWPIPFARIAGKEIIEKYAKQGIRLEKLDGIRGGEVVPHLHLGDEVIILDRSQFKELVGEVATKLATDLVEKLDYDKVVDVIGQFAIDTVPVPESPNL